MWTELLALSSNLTALQSDALAHGPRLLNATYIDSLYLSHIDTFFYQDTNDKLLLKIKNSYALEYY
jgi:hypothetical protein